jgi:methionine-rich copper-binding protein CopC
VTYNAATRIATLTPSSLLAAGTTFTASVRGGTTDPRVKDVAGNALAANKVWTFTTSADATAPTVTARSPASGATGVNTATTVTATFSEAMDATTISTSTFELRDSSNALLAATVTYNAATRIATLTPSSLLTAGATYTATVRGGTTDPRVKDLAGNALAANSTWSFTTSGDVTPPTVTATSPASGSTGVNGTTNVTATFSEAMNAATINTGTFVLRDPSNAVVAAAVSYNTTSFVATLNPSPTLNPGATYTATVVSGASGAKDATGNALAADKVWTFTTDSTPPTVTSTSPTNGATGVARNTSITATFSEAMDPATLTTSTFVLRNPSNAVVSATVTLGSNQLVATLNPSSSLASGTTYTATVVSGSAGVKDVSGNPMVANKVWIFTTR